VNRGEVVASEPTPVLLGRLDTRAVVITPQDPIATAPTIAGFDARLRPDGRLAVTYKTGAASVEQVLAAARAAGVSIKDLATEEPDLEDVFLALTYNDPGAADPLRD
jgi:ABC-2 type transport system ATP-binding protein